MDLFFYNGEISREGANKIIRSIQKRTKSSQKSNEATLYLITAGGNPDAAYKIAKFFQTNYDSFNVAVPGACKSAGTLIALGAKTIYFSNNGELGPLDMQLSRSDEVTGLLSSLVATKGIDAVQAKAYASFEEFFINLLVTSQGKFTSKTAADIAVRLTESLYRPIMEQFDPMKVGEYARSTEVATEYGKRLDRAYNNLKTDSLSRLIYSYPSHGFILDYQEAKELFCRVEPFSEELRKGLETAVKLQDKYDKIFCISEASDETQATEDESRKTRRDTQGSTLDKPRNKRVDSKSKRVRKVSTKVRPRKT